VKKLLAKLEHSSHSLAPEYGPILSQDIEVLIEIYLREKKDQ
jgi:hypothetical protein